MDHEDTKTRRTEDEARRTEMKGNGEKNALDPFPSVPFFVSLYS
jgi:hypothetical protein